jgi:hypothetical protein
LAPIGTSFSCGAGNDQCAISGGKFNDGLGSRTTEITTARFVRFHRQQQT